MSESARDRRDIMIVAIVQHGGRQLERCIDRWSARATGFARARDMSRGLGGDSDANRVVVG